MRATYFMEIDYFSSKVNYYLRPRLREISPCSFEINSDLFLLIASILFLNRNYNSYL